MNAPHPETGVGVLVPANITDGLDDEQNWLNNAANFSRFFTIDPRTAFKAYRV